MKKAIVLFLCIVSIHCMAQDEKKNEGKKKSHDSENLFTGGSVSFNLGGYDNTFLIGLHPHLGYTLAKWIDAAVVVNFEYLSSRDQFNDKFHNTTYGLGAFTRIYPVKFIFLQAEPEYNFIAAKYIPNGGIALKQTVHAPSLLLGLGYTTSRSDKNTFTYFSLLIDVLKDINSPYVDGYGNILPVVRAGINIGLNRKHGQSNDNRSNRRRYQRRQFFR